MAGIDVRVDLIGNIFGTLLSDTDDGHQAPLMPICETSRHKMEKGGDVVRRRPLLTYVARQGMSGYVLTRLWRRRNFGLSKAPDASVVRHK